MGKINLTPLRVRTRHLAERRAGRPSTTLNAWADITGDIPPAQILVRNQPQPQSVARIRTRTLSNGRTEQYTLPSPTKKIKAGKKASRMFAPVEIKYEEDELRQQFFRDHPWELARPRIVVETTGNQHLHSDYTRGLKQPGIPLSGESVVQRQLALLQTVPDMTTASAYDIARREFYQLRRQEATSKRIAREEAAHMGAEPDRSILQWSQEIENKVYDEWEEWSRSQVVEQMQRSAAFSGEIAGPTEEGDQGLKGNQQMEKLQAARGVRAPGMIGGPFEGEARRRERATVPA